MKKLILFTFLIPIFVSSQINVNHTNLPDIGDTVITMSDYGSYNHGNSGANQNEFVDELPLLLMSIIVILKK